MCNSGKRLPQKELGPSLGGVLLKAPDNQWEVGADQNAPSKIQ